MKATVRALPRTRAILANGAWPLACALAVAPALGGPSTAAQALAWDWQPALAWAQPWRAVTAAWVHWSASHLAMNLVGAALLALLGHRAGLGGRAVLAWALAWPLTHGGLLAQPALLHYGGLSGVLHAGLGVVLVGLWHGGADSPCGGAARCLSRPRAVALGLGLGLLCKLASEAAWVAPLHHGPGWDFAVAPLAHVTGSVAGWASAAALGWRAAPRA